MLIGAGKVGLEKLSAIIANSQHAQVTIIARDILLAHSVGSRLHICHLSTKGSVEIVRWAKSQGMAVTAEVTPHHLILTDELARSYDPIYKVNPPLRTQADVDALRAGLADGTIDIVATDHAPHPGEDKDCEWASAALGMVGLETAFSIVYTTMVESGLMSWQRLIEVMSVKPAEIGGYANQGQEISIGSIANLTIVDPKAERVIDRNDLFSKGKNTPFHGSHLRGDVVHTIFRGKVVLRDQEMTGVVHE